MGEIRVLVVDDDPTIRRTLTVLLEAADGFACVGVAEDGRLALERYLATRPDVVIMDLQMPGLDGIEATRELLQEEPGARILAVTAFSSEHYVVPALRQGVAGYLLKDSSPQVILDAITRVHHGEVVLSPRITRQVVRSLRESPHQPDDAAPEPVAEEEDATVGGLTPRESDVIEMLAMGLSNREIGEALFISEATVKGTLGRIMQRWGVRDRLQVLIHAARLGLVTLE